MLAGFPPWQQAAPRTGLPHVSLSSFKQEFSSFQSVFSDTSSLAACSFLEPPGSHKRELSVVTKSDLPLTHRLYPHISLAYRQPDNALHEQGLYHCLQIVCRSQPLRMALGSPTGIAEIQLEADTWCPQTFFSPEVRGGVSTLESFLHEENILKASGPLKCRDKKRESPVVEGTGLPKKLIILPSKYGNLWRRRGRIKKS